MRAHAISEAGLALIKTFEGFRAEPMALEGGGWVVGHGHVRIGEPGAPMSEEDAAGLLALDLAPIERCVNEQVTAPLTQSQFDALCSFCLSVGQDAFAKSDVVRKVNAGKMTGAACAMDAWRKSSVEGESEIYDALIVRRAAEKALFLKDAVAVGGPSVYFRAELDHAAAILAAPIAAMETPELGKPRAPKARPAAPAQKLTEILKSEPQTALLLTQVVDADVDMGDEIVTAHHAPVARAMVPAVIKQPSLIQRAKARWSAARTAENAGLSLLLAFGAALIALSFGLMTSHGADGGDLIAAAALGAPGVIAAAFASYCFFKGAPARA